MAALVVGAVVVFALATAFALGAIWARERVARRGLPPATAHQIDRARRANLADLRRVRRTGSGRFVPAPAGDFDREETR